MKGVDLCDCFLLVNKIERIHLLLILPAVCFSDIHFSVFRPEGRRVKYIPDVNGCFSDSPPAQSDDGLWVSSLRLKKKGRHRTGYHHNSFYRHDMSFYIFMTSQNTRSTPSSKISSKFNLFLLLLRHDRRTTSICNFLLYHSTFWLAGVR